MKIIGKTVTEIESGEQVALGLGCGSLTVQYTGTDLSVKGTIDGENETDVAAVSLEDYSVSTGSFGAGIYKILLVGGVVRLIFTFTDGKLTACAE